MTAPPTTTVAFPPGPSFAASVRAGVVAVRATRLPRRGRRVLATLLLAAAAGYVLWTTSDALVASLGALAAADSRWAAAGIAIIAARYALAAVSLQAAVAARIPFWPTLHVQLASAFIGRFTPEGVGWLVLNQRYLERSGIVRSSALAAIALKLLAGGLTRIGIAGAVVVAAGGSGVTALDLPPVQGIHVVAAFLGVALVAFLVRTMIRRRPTALASVRAGAADLAAVLRQPRRAAVLLGSSAGLTIASALALVTSVHALGADVPLATVFVIYLGGTAVAALSPTPGNLGAVEVSLTAGLTAVGVPAPTALAAVLLYRVTTFWLPVVPGVLAFRRLQVTGRI
jgi:undecaprenyl-diphosphatase